MSETKVARMTAAEAQHFERYSVQNAATVSQALICGCEPYKDVFTFNRWIAQGYAVQRGQKAIKISTITEKVDEETGETKRLFHVSAVFCRHQVKAISEKGNNDVRPVSTEPARPVENSRANPSASRSKFQLKRI